MKSRSVSQREAARLLGVSRSTFRDWIDQKRIKANAEGLISPKELAKARKLVEAREEREERDDEAGDLETQLLKAKVAKETALAEIQRIKADFDAGVYVKRADVEADAQAAAVAIRDGVLSLGARVALQVEASLAKEPRLRTAAIEALITDEVNQVLDALNKRRFGGDA